MLLLLPSLVPLQLLVVVVVSVGLPPPPPTLDAQNYPEQLPPHQLQSPQQLMAPPHQLLMLLLLLPSLVPLQLLLMVVR
jgi:hypothetical protein